MSTSVVCPPMVVTLLVSWLEEPIRCVRPVASDKTARSPVPTLIGRLPATLLSCKLSFQLIWSIYTSFDLYIDTSKSRHTNEANSLYLAIFKQHWGKKDVSIQLIFHFTANLIQLGRLNEFNQFAVRLLAEDMLKNCCLNFVRKPCFPKIYFFLFFLFNPSIFKCL